MNHTGQAACKSQIPKILTLVGSQLSDYEGELKAARNEDRIESA